MSIINDVLSTESIEQLFQEPMAVLLKHSSLCPVSFSAKNEFEKFVSSCKLSCTFYLVDVIAQRNMSNELAVRTGIQHKSPQTLVVVNGTVDWNESHYAITENSLHMAVENAAGTES